ncbi:DASH complex subunit SPC19 [Kwoniella heveanensis CBS 569]|nr:DASH complex subunit SPC19 [Kwoniella heveanensis CBS 569]
MARASSLTQYLPRESVYPTAPPSSDFLNVLEDCVQATETCSKTLGNGIARFEGGTRDLGRLCKVMRHKHHYLVLPEPTIAAHKSALGASLAPQIEQLIVRAEGLVDSENAKVANLEERLRILESARLPPSSPQTGLSFLSRSTRDTATASTTATTDNNVPADTSCKIADVDMKGLNVLQRKKMMMLKQKRERLEKEMKRLASGGGA